MTDKELKEKVIRKMLSYREIIPSVNFDEYGYSLYLQYASAGELENDIVSEKTYLKMIYEGNWDYDEHLVDDKIRMKYF